MSIVKHKVYGSAHKATLYYLTGYGDRPIRHYLPHIYALMLGGFRVVAFGYDKSILSKGDPQLLIEALQDIAHTINQDKKKHKVAGVYGISLGSWLGCNVLAMCHIKRGMFNTGAVSIVRAIWKNERLHAEKAAFKKQGYTMHSLKKIWGKYDFDTSGARFKGKKVVVINSTNDDIIDINEARANIAEWHKDNPDMRLITTSHRRHGPAIWRHSLRLRQTIQFFQDAKKDVKARQQVIPWSGSSKRRG